MIWSVVLIHLTGYQLQVRLSPEPFLSQFRLVSDPLSPSPTFGSLPFQLVFDSCLDAKLSTAPHTVHFTREVSSELGSVNYQQRLVIVISCFSVIRPLLMIHIPPFTMYGSLSSSCLAVIRSNCSSISLYLPLLNCS